MTEEKFVNRIKTSDGTSYDIQDKRIDTVEEGTVDKVIGFDEQGNLIKGTVSGGNSNIPDITLEEDDTGSTIAQKIGMDLPQPFSSKTMLINVMENSFVSPGLYLFTISYYGLYYVYIISATLVEGTTSYKYSSPSGGNLDTPVSNYTAKANNLNTNLYKHELNFGTTSPLTSLAIITLSPLQITDSFPSSIVCGQLLRITGGASYYPLEIYNEGSNIGVNALKISDGTIEQFNLFFSELISDIVTEL